MLEVCRMALYLSMPVGMYYYANMPSVNERWRRNWRQEVYDTSGVSVVFTVFFGP